MADTYRFSFVCSTQGYYESRFQLYILIRKKRKDWDTGVSHSFLGKLEAKCI